MILCQIMDIIDFAFLGGISYFIYAYYLVLKIRNDRSKIILLGFLSSLLAFSIGLILIDIYELIFIILPIINLIFQVFLLIKNSGHANQAIRKSYLISLVITLILSVSFLFLWFLTFASSGIPSNHY